LIVLFILFISVLFLMPRKVPKEARPAAWPSAFLAQTFFPVRAGTRPLRGAQTACPLLSEKSFCARRRCNGRD